MVQTGMLAGGAKLDTACARLGGARAGQSARLRLAAPASKKASRSAAVVCAVNAPTAEPDTRMAPAGVDTKPTGFLNENWPTTTPHTGWHSLTEPLLWEGTDADARWKADSPFAELSAPWKIMLLSNGSVTRHLELITGLPVDVDCLEMENIGSGAPGIPSATALLDGPLVQRQVLLRSSEPGPAGERGDPLVYASSWWAASEVDVYLADKALPIWASLNAGGRTELHRDIRHVSFGDSTFLQEQLGEKGPFWGRQYIFWTNRRPVTLIHEVFSPKLTRFLGPVNQQ